MKKLLLLLFLSVTASILSQVTNEGKPASWSLVTKASITANALPPIDLQKIKEEDDINDKNRTKPYRVGISQKVNYGLNNGGTWTQLANGDRIWRVWFDSQDAVNLSVIFDKFSLPKGGKIYLYNDDRSDLLGAYTDVQNNEKEVLSTWFVKGDKIWVEYYEPKNVKGQGKLNISAVIHCYRMGHTYQKGYYNDIQKSLNSSGICNHDVDCPIGTDFEAERDLLKKAVGFLFMPDGSGGAFICSGTLINNTAEDKTPYFLTANHCFGTDPALYTMRFNWISPNPVCAAGTGSTDATDNFTMSGSSLIAKNADSDFMLVKINNPIPPNWDVTYAGWDRTDTDPIFEVSIHHPDGDIMKISRDDTGAIKGAHSIGGPTAQTWDITTAGGGWEIGVTEGGSSGSALFDQNGRIIGQLFGGAAACNGIDDNGQIDFYGRFAVSWDSGAISTFRLNNWLDPIGTNPNTLDALENVLAVNDEFLEQNISVFPNPTSGFVQIKIREWTSDLDYEIYNTLGQTLKTNRLQNNEILDLTDLPSDIYFMKITEIDTNKILIKKIVLNK